MDHVDAVAFWALHRTLDDRQVARRPAHRRLFVALQMLSSIYYGIFLDDPARRRARCCCCVSQPAKARWASVRALAPGAVLAALLCGAYAAPYLETKSRTGGRQEVELVTFSARPSSYLVATPDNVIWGRSFAGRGRMERRLFPGVVVTLLALVGLFLRPPPAVALVYLVALALAFDMSLGLSGYTYRMLYEHVPLYQGLRALARLGIFVVFFLAALAAYGYAALAASLPRAGRAGLARSRSASRCCSSIASGGSSSCRIPTPRRRYTNGSPTSRAGVVAELPMSPDALPGARSRLQLSLDVPLAADRQRV